jgi:hypothetical protein
MEIPCILDKHTAVASTLNLHLPADLVHVISEYADGFVHIGNLETSIFKNQEFVDNYTSAQIKYKVFPSIGGLYFFDFWNVDTYESGDTLYPSGWNINHYSFIYRPTGKIYRDKVQFFLMYDIYELSQSKPSYPIYDIKKLLSEFFNVFSASEHIKKISDHEIYQAPNLLKIFADITEGFAEGFYAVNKRQLTNDNFCNE